MFLITVLEKEDKDVKGMPLSNNISRIDETTKFESAERDTETLLVAYIKYINNGEFTEEMLLCEALKTTTMPLICTIN